MAMDEEVPAVPDGPLSPCGHRNPPSAHFCDVCGVRLPMHCPRCHAINRALAHFCNNCGLGLRDGRQTPATSSFVRSPAAPATPPAIESGAAAGPAEPSMPATPAANDDWDGPERVAARLRTGGNARELIADEREDAERLELMKQFLQRRRRSRRTG